MNNSDTPAISMMVSGEAACFRRPEFVDDLVSYDVMPPTVARRLLGAICPMQDGIWRLSRLRVLKPIRSRWQEINTARGRRRALVLTDVCYIIEASLQYANNRHDRTIASRPGPGGLTAHLGLADFPAVVTVLDSDQAAVSALADTGTVDLGWMLYATADRKHNQFFRATMIDGAIDFERSEVIIIAS